MRFPSGTAEQRDSVLCGAGLTQWDVFPCVVAGAERSKLEVYLKYVLSFALVVLVSAVPASACGEVGRETTQRLTERCPGFLGIVADNKVPLETKQVQPQQDSAVKPAQPNQLAGSAAPRAQRWYWPAGHPDAPKTSARRWYWKAGDSDAPRLKSERWIIPAPDNRTSQR